MLRHISHLVSKSYFNHDKNSTISKKKGPKKGWNTFCLTGLKKFIFSEGPSFKRLESGKIADCSW